MKRFLPLLIFFLLTFNTAFAQQALILTEIEQIQEKIWYLQRDLASQQALVAQAQRDIERLTRDQATAHQAQAETITQLLQALEQQEKATQQTGTTIADINETIENFRSELAQFQRGYSDQTQQTNRLEGELRALNEKISAIETTSETFINETRDQLARLRQAEQIDLNNIIVWGGGGALALSILITLILLLRSGRAKSSYYDRRPPSDHQL